MFNIDKVLSYGVVIIELKCEGKLDWEMVYWQVKYFNNVIEVDYGKFKILIKLVCGFKLIFMVYVMIKGFEVM